MSLCVGNLAHSIKAIQLKLKYKSTNFVQALEGGVHFGVHAVAKKIRTLAVLHDKGGF